VRQKILPNFEVLQLSYFFSKNETKILQDSVFNYSLYNHDLLIFYRC